MLIGLERKLDQEVLEFKTYVDKSDKLNEKLDQVGLGFGLGDYDNYFLILLLIVFLLVTIILRYS